MGKRRRLKTCSPVPTSNKPTHRVLRHYDEANHWIPTDAEIAEQAQTQLLEERRQRERLLEQLRARGIDPNELLG